MKGKDNFSFCGSSLNDISLYLKQKEAWIHRRKVLDSLCSRSCIVPFGVYFINTIAFLLGTETQEYSSLVRCTAFRKKTYTCI